MIKTYYAIHATFAHTIGNDSAARYDNRQIVLFGDFPTNWQGGGIDITDLASGSEEYEHYLPIIEKLRTDKPEMIIFKLPSWLAHRLYKEHPAFMPEITEEIL